MNVIRRCAANVALIPVGNMLIDRRIGQDRGDADARAKPQEAATRVEVAIVETNVREHLAAGFDPWTEHPREETAPLRTVGRSHQAQRSLGRVLAGQDKLARARGVGHWSGSAPAGACATKIGGGRRIGCGSAATCVQNRWTAAFDPAARRPRAADS